MVPTGPPLPVRPHGLLLCTEVAGSVPADDPHPPQQPVRLTAHRTHRIRLAWIKDGYDLLTRRSTPDLLGDPYLHRQLAGMPSPSTLQSLALTLLNTNA
jgi:hypothetical protein